MSKIKDKLVVVDWEDTATDAGWARRTEADHAPIVCRSVGYILKKTTKRLTIFASKSTHGSVADRTVIPIGCIKRIRRVKEPK